MGQNKQNAVDSIIIVDIQNGFINDYTKDIPVKIKDFLDKYSITHKIFTRFINPGPDGPFEQILKWSRFVDTGENSEIEIVDELLDYPTSIIDKCSYSPFKKKTLGNFLKENQIGQTYICGIDTDICVLQTTVDVFSLNIQPIVLSDLCMSHAGHDYHEYALKILPRLIGKRNVKTTTDL